MSSAPRRRRFAAAALGNLSLLPALVLRRPFPRDRVDAGPAQILLSFLLTAVAAAGYYLWLGWPVEGLDPYGVAPFFGGEILILASVTLGALLVANGRRIGPALVMVNLSSLPVFPLTIVLVSLWPESVVSWIAVMLVQLVLPALALLRTLVRPGRFGRLAGVPAYVLLVASTAAWLLFVPQTDVFYTDYGDEAYADEGPEIVTEELYYAQPALMQTAFDRLAPGDPDRPELFAVLGGGYAYQSVFLSEVDRVGDLLAARHGADHVIALANSADAPMRLPMLGHHNLAAALAGVSARMGPEDTLLLFLTSHGSEDSFSLYFYEAQFEDLTARDLAETLDAADIPNAVIVLSACHSGSFIDELAGPSRLIITAAAADRTSFGCADGRDWTEFGRAYFDIALRETPDFRTAFARATAVIETWETEQGRRPSLPQIAEGAEIGPVLDRLFTTAAPPT